MNPLLQLFLARLREFYREPEAIFWVYGFPLILAVGLGIAFWDKKPEPAQVDVQEAGGGLAEDLRGRLEAAGLVAEVHTEAECRQRLRTGKTALFVQLLAENRALTALGASSVGLLGASHGQGPLLAASAIYPGRPENCFRYVYDQARPEGLAARCEADAAVLRWKTGVRVERQDADGGPATQYQDGQGGAARYWTTADAPVSEPGSRYIDFLIPGLMGLNIMGGGLFGVGFLIVDMRVRKLLKRLVATPMRRSDFLLAVFGGRLVMLVPEMGVLLLLARLAFGVPVRGSPLLLGLIIFLGSFAFAGIGLLLASRTSKTETISGLINLVMLPGWLLSGTFFSAKRFPDAVQPFIQALPLTQLNDALREVMLEGASAVRVGWRLAALAAWGGVAFLLAARRFRWQ
jgi:hypothetical protein